MYLVFALLVHNSNFPQQLIQLVSQAVISLACGYVQQILAHAALGWVYRHVVVVQHDNQVVVGAGGVVQSLERQSAAHRSVAYQAHDSASLFLRLVALCHRKGIQVVPLVGPSSLMLALMASGLNGQSFAFRGYLPAKTPERRKALCELEKLSAKTAQSQIFIETPYRNDAMLQDILQCCNGQTKLCIATNISAEDEKFR